MALKRVEANVTVGNIASRRVLEELGFHREGRLRQRGYGKARITTSGYTAFSSRTETLRERPCADVCCLPRVGGRGPDFADDGHGTGCELLEKLLKASDPLGEPRKLPPRSNSVLVAPR